MKQVVEVVRKSNNAPQIFQWFEYLYNEMKKREQRQSMNTGARGSMTVYENGTIQEGDLTIKGARTLDF